TLENNGSWWKVPTIAFKWNAALRADSYQLRASTLSYPWRDPAPVLNVPLGSGTTTYTGTFSQDYARLYWSVKASNSAVLGNSDPGIWFGIDRGLPSCKVQPLPATSFDSIVTLSWAGTDSSSGPGRFDIQVQDSTRGPWTDWLNSVPATKTT